MVPAGPDRPGADCAREAGAMHAETDLALLSSIAAQLDDLAARVTEMAERYGASPDSAVASELFGAERSVLAARRAIDRAAAGLEDLRG